MDNASFPPGIIVYIDRLLPFAESKSCSDEDFGKAIKALVKYSSYGGEMPELEGSAEIVFNVIRPDWERGVRNYRQKCEEKSEHGKYMAYCRSLKPGEPKMSKEQFLASLRETEEDEDVVARAGPSDNDLMNIFAEKRKENGIG